MGGAAESCLRMLTISRAAHRALHIPVERHGIRAARKNCIFTYTRERHRRTQDAA